MGVITWAESRAKAMTIWDIAFLKISSMMFGLIIGAYFASFVTRNVWWFVVVFLVLHGRVGYRWFTAKAP
ncbi:MAG: hypothetical protein Q8N53_23510 [Longimicrobiales bacterium]|nr:hypothetical protein [Longimicrobiales bacterium]